MIPSGTQFIGFSPSVNLKEKKSNVINSESVVYTMDELRGYKVYTALVTQSGGDDLIFITEGELEIGRTYTIDSDCADQDFTNVGAPNNIKKTNFIATGTTPANWGTCGTGLSYRLGAPVVTVLENTIGNIWFSYNNVGEYMVHSDDLFLDGKTTTSISPVGYIESPADVYNSNIVWQTERLIYLTSYYNNVLVDDSLNYAGGTSIEIRVYN